jgi:hypothetical protein
MNRLLIRTIAVLTLSSLGVAVGTPAQQPIPLEVIAGPSLEAVGTDSAIVTWTTNGSSNSVVSYGADRNHLTFSAASPNRWNRNLPSMVHRVLIVHLRPGTTYFYAVDFGSAKSGVASFTTQAH